MMMTRFWKGRVLAALMLALGVTTAHAQSVNLDFDVEFGGYEAGAGVPSSSFGGAANQPGFWTLIGAAQHTHAYPMFDLEGNATAATVRWNSSGGGRGGGVRNTGDFRLLLYDCTIITLPTTYHFENLLPGRYQVTTYSIDRIGRVRPTRVTVQGAVVPVKISGNGSMPENQFIEGVTHASHSINVAGSSFTVKVESIIDREFGAVNGMQLSYEPVPEPGAIISLGLCLAWFLSARKKS